MNQRNKNKSRMMGLNLSTTHSLVAEKDEAFDLSAKVLPKRILMVVVVCLSAFTALAQIPAVPTSVTATTASSTQINLTWVDASSNETGFQIERSTTSGSGFALIFTTAANAVSYSDAGVVANTMYYYRVRSANGSGSSAYSTQTGSSTITPAAPTTLTAIAATTTSINLAWVDSSADETGFQIWMSTTAGSGYSLIATNPANQVTRSVTGLSVNVRYYFQVRAINGALTSAYTNEANAITSTPAIPTSVTAIATSPTQITLSWVDNATTETGYGVERSTTSGSGFVLVTTTAVNATGFVDTGLTTGTTYYYRIRALNGGLASAYTTQISTALVVPAVPTTLAATAASATQVNLTWVDAATNETGFVVERSTTSGSGFAIVTTTAANATSYSDVSAVANTTYYYRIRSANGVGSSANTAEVVVATSIPAIPTNPLATFTNSSGQASITWTDASNNETAFQVERSTTSGTGFVWIVTTAADATSFLNTGLTPGTTYYYRVRSLNQVGYSTYSPEVSVTIAVPPAPGNVTAVSVSATQINLTWTDPCSYETGYLLERSTLTNTSGFSTIATIAPNTVSYSDINLTTETIYYYRFRTINGAVGSNPVTLTVPLTIPAVPTSFSGSPSSTTSINLYWVDNSSNETGFEIERSTSSGTGFSLITTTAANYTTFANTGLTAGTTYYYRIRAKNAVGFSAYLPEYIIAMAAPAAPISLTATTVSTTQINLAWSDNSTNESTFRIERSISAAGPFTVVFNTNPNFVSYSNNTGLSPGIQYFYRLLSSNGVGSSAYTPVVSAATNLIAPTNLVATAFSTNQINLTWTDGSANETGYQIERSLTSGSGFTLVATTAANATAYSDAGLTGETPYYYRIRAINAVGNSLYTTESTATTLVAPPTTLTGVAVSTTQIKLKWVDASLVETGFQIERSTTSATGFTLVNTTPANTTEYIDQGLTANTQYYYRIRSVNAAVVSPYTSELPYKTLTQAEEALNNLAFLYKYDGRNRMSHKKVPGADWVYLVYDNRDRLVMTQDGNQRSLNQWTFTKYDVLNRPVLTGIYSTGSSVYDQVAMQGLVNSYYNNLATNNGSWFETFSSSGAVHGYDNKSYPLVSDVNQFLTVTYYDDYSFKALYSNDPANDYRTNQLSSQTSATGTYTQPTTWNAQVKGQVTATKTKVLGSAPATFLLNIVYYDDKYRTIQTIADNHKGGKDCTTNIYDFSGKVLATKTVHGLPSVADKSTARTFDYDHAGRLLKTWHSVNGATPVLLTKNEYNEIGQLVDKKLHSTDNGTTFKQSVDYRYNIRGWLTSMNDASLANNGTTNDDTGDLFGMNLGYNNDLGIGNTALYNGNISGITWSNSLGLSTTKQNAYVYTYDAMNRIQSSAFKEKAVSWTSPTNAALAETGYQYDLNGNIATLQRNDRRASGWMDNLAYTYSGNQLKNVKDNGDANAGFMDGNPSTTIDDYAYDANGNMVTDKNKSLTAANAIQYNHLNLPSIVTKSTGEFVKYTYDAGGRKLKQEVFNASSVVTKTTDYIGEYIYENNVLQFVNHEEGRFVTTGASPEYQYHLKDHLGNVRLTFTSKVEAIPETGTLEDANAITEQSQFLRFANAKRVKATILDKTNGSSIGYAERLNGSTNEKYGLAKSLSVMPGDVINIEVYAKYIDTNSANWTGALTTLMSQIASNNTAVVFDGGSYSSSTSSFNASYPGLLGTKTDNGAPKAYLNWLVFDRNYVSLTGGFKQITTAGKEAGTDVAHELINSPAINITTAGYVYIWLSNENATPVEIYFDDLKVTQTKSPVIESQDFYPFGLSYNKSSRENALPNKLKLFQGQEHIDDLGLNWDSFKWRNHQPDIGRFFNIDPISEKYYYNSPYAFSENQVVAHRELEGLEKIPVNHDGLEDALDRAASNTTNVNRTGSSIQVSSTDAKGKVVNSTTIQLPSTSTQGQVSDNAAKTIGEVAMTAKEPSVTVSSVKRNATDQARAMHQNLEGNGPGQGVANQSRLYAGRPGAQVVSTFVKMKALQGIASHFGGTVTNTQVRNAMEVKINELGVSNVTNHASVDPKMNVVDVAPSSVGNTSGFVKAAQNHSGVDKFIPYPKDPGHHFEIKDP